MRTKYVSDATDCSDRIMCRKSRCFLHSAADSEPLLEIPLVVWLCTRSQGRGQCVKSACSTKSQSKEGLAVWPLVVATDWICESKDAWAPHQQLHLVNACERIPQNEEFIMEVKAASIVR